MAFFNFPVSMKQLVDFSVSRPLTFEVQLFRGELFVVHPGVRGKAFIREVQVQGADDEFTELHVGSMNIKFYFAHIVTSWCSVGR